MHERPPRGERKPCPAFWALPAALLSPLAAVALCVVSAAASAATLGVPLGPDFFFDAEKTRINRKLERQEFEGDVVAIGAGSIITADQVSVDKKSQILEAEGHLVILSGTQVFTGESVVYHLDTGDFVMTEALMVAGNRERVKEATNRILGFTQAEIAFEQARNERLSELRAEQERLRREAVRQKRTEGEISEDLVDRYELLTERERLIREQKNPVHVMRGERQQERYARRREYWEKSRSKALAKFKGAALTRSYFQLEGNVIQRVNDNDYYARNALFTPCLCDEDETPAWGFSADRAQAQVGGYADLYHPVLRIKGIPVLYLPYLKIPIKDERQSGFLPPTFGFEPRSGNIYSQPVYFALGKNRDATFTTDVFEKRGTRLGAEYRFQQRENSGWQLHAEAIRDQLWMEERGLRDSLRDYYKEGLLHAFRNPGEKGNGIRPKPGAPISDRQYTRQVLRDPDYWAKLRSGKLDEDKASKFAREINEHLAVPENSWRGAYGWRGVTYFAPRLSFVSHGEITSDHRYSEDLYVPDDFRDAFFGGEEAPAYKAARGRVHLDARDFYAGVGSRFGDNFLLDDQFDGQQLPLRFKVQTRHFSLLPEESPIPIYATLSGETRRITELKADAPAFGPLEVEEEEVSLGNGHWRNLDLETVSPLLTDAVFQVSHFTQLQARYVEHQGLAENASEMRSWRTGLEFSLPVDGKGRLPGFLQDEPQEGGEAAPDKFAHHIMDWRLRASVRPVVVKRGPYTNEYADGGDLAYFAVDRFTGANVDDDVPEEERMKAHRRLTLVTNHAWKLFRRRYVPIDLEEGEVMGPPAPESAPDPKEVERLELLRELNLAPEDSEDGAELPTMNWDPGSDDFEPQDDYYATPVNLRAQIAYDFLDAEDRREARRHNRPLNSEIREQKERRNQLKDRLEDLDESEADEEERKELKDELDAVRDRIGKLRSRKDRLPEPWKGPRARMTLRHRGWTLGGHINYNVYAKQAEKLGLDLTLPKFFQTNLSLGYDLDKTIDLQKHKFTRTQVRKLNVATSLIPPVTSYISVRQRRKDNQTPDYTRDYKIAYGFKYNSDARCWGLRFAREKDYGHEEDQAEYLLQLSVTFVGQQRELPDMASGVVRTLGEEDNNS